MKDVPILAVLLIRFFFLSKKMTIHYYLLFIIYLFIIDWKSMLLRIFLWQTLSAKLRDVLPVLRNLLAESTHACCRWSERVHTPNLRCIFSGFFAEREFCLGAGSVNLIPWLLREVLVRVRMLTVCRFTAGERHGSFFFKFLVFLWTPHETERTADSGRQRGAKGIPRVTRLLSDTPPPTTTTTFLHHKSHSGEVFHLPD